MKKLNPYEISQKKYNTDYRTTKRLWTDPQYQLFLLKNIANHKKLIGIKKHIVKEAQLFNILKDVQTYLISNESKSIQRFVGYTVNHLESNKKNQFKFWIILIFEFKGENLYEVISKHFLTRQKRQGLQLLTKLGVKLLEMFSQLESNKRIELSSIMLDLGLINVSNVNLLDQQFYLSFFPLTCMKEHKVRHQDFHQQVYSARQLRIINRQTKDKPQLQQRSDLPEIILQSQRQTETQNCNRDILQKIGLLMLKFMYLYCRDIEFQQARFELYCMNQAFDVDFNWDSIDEYLQKCEQEKEYFVVSRQVRFMIRECQEERSFQQYYQHIKNISLSSLSHKRDISASFEITEPKQMPDFYSLQGPKIQNFQKQISNFLKLRQIQTFLQSKSVQQLSYEDGSHYRGQLKNNQRDGFGIYTFAQGDIFGGQWRNGSMSGKGFYYFTTNERYQGQIQGGIKHGRGSYYYNNGDRYEGMWKNDLKDGYGQFYCAKTGEVYKGQFRNNLKENKGIVIYPNGQRYQGFFSHGLKNGQGCLFDPQGRLFLRSKWKNDLTVNPVELFMPNNDYYLGQMVNNKKHGKGVYKYQNGTIYEGTFLDDRQTGQCYIKFLNGDTYEGGILDGLFQGPGKYFYKENNLIYEGSWRQGVQDGNGIYLDKNQMKMQVIQKQRNLLSYTITTK